MTSVISVRNLAPGTG